jgi:4a-hydroxytetrahydrobiopterin dehydratase
MTIALSLIEYQSGSSLGLDDMKTVNELTKMKCVACHPGVPPITDLEIAQFKPQLLDWQLIKQDNIRRLQRLFKFDDFKQAMAFSQQVGELAEQEDHHPMLLIVWGKVTVTWWTTAIKGLHRNDFIMAAKTDEIYRSVQQKFAPDIRPTAA